MKQIRVVGFAIFILTLGLRGPCRGAEADIGQILMVGFNEAVATPELIKHLRKIKPGAIILFRRNIQNPKQLEHLINQLQRQVNPYLSAPLLFAIDQEGGSVYRIPVNPKIPSPAALGRSQDPQIVERYGAAIGHLLRRNGISMNLAPVLDLDIKNTDSFIGSRSFGTDPALVAQLGFLFAKGLASAGVVPTGKHFPGLGSVLTDPHEQTPVSDLEWNVDWNRELLPFREFSRLSPSALMLSHVIYPKLDSQRLPASVSPYIIKSVLRDTLGYQGLVITDDLLMKGITSKLAPSDAALASLNSGADLVMLSWSKQDQLLVYNHLKSSLANNRLDKQELLEKVNRIAKVKSLIGLNGTVAATSTNWQSSEIKILNQELLEKNLERDRDLYKPAKQNSQFYFVNLSSTWPIQFARRFPNAKMRMLKDLASFQKLETSEKQQGLLLIGVANKAARKQIDRLTKQERLQIVLIITNEISIDKPEHYHSVFLPLWPFEGIAKAVVKYL
jgi:beta-N-acetylhexosaminidase